MALEEGKNVAENNNDVYHPITELVSRPKVIRLKFQPAIMYPRKRRSFYFCLFFFLSFSFGIVFFAKKPGEKCNRIEVYETVKIMPKVRLPNEKKSLLFVGVMTAKRYLSTRATAVYETWGKEIQGKIEFFSSEWSSPPENKPDLPLVPLKGVDDSYPPQKKSFLMLQYMWENYGDKFEWFLRADDDVYIRPEKLEAFLRSVDSSKALFVGQAGRGNQEEFGLLSLEYDENFCMGGPGVIMSRETLSRVAPHVKYCLRNLYTNHEDVELGRCVQKFAGIPCTWSYEMQTIFYHNSSGNEAFSGSLKKKEIHKAITLHPVKKYKNLHRIHNYMMLLKIQDKKHEVIKLEREILSTDEIIKQSNFSSKVFTEEDLQKSLILGQQPSLTKSPFQNETEVLFWEFIQRSQFSWSSANPRRKIDASLREGLDDIIREVMEMINMYSKERGRIIDFKELLYGYHRFNPVFGADYILDMLLVFKKYRGRKMTVPVRRHTYAQQQFSDMSFREVKDGEEVGINLEEERDNSEKTPSGIKEAFEIGLMKISENLPAIIFPTDRGDVKKTKMINFVVPLSGREEVFKRFIKNFEEVCLQNRENVSLIVVLFPSDKEGSVQNVLDSVKSLQKKYPYAKITAVPVFENFSRANALSIGAKQVEPIDLLFFIDVDIVFQSETLRRIRTNTIQGKSVYFPIVYSEYDPEIVYNQAVSPNHFNFSDTTGYWRQYGFGIVSVYKSDLLKVGGFNTDIKGWGKEDVDLFDKFVAFSENVTIFRTVDPALVHVFHVVGCDRNLEPQQLKMCKATRADTYGSVKQLSEYYNNNRHRINTVSHL